MDKGAHFQPFFAWLALDHLLVLHGRQLPQALVWTFLIVKSHRFAEHPFEILQVFWGFGFQIVVFDRPVEPQKLAIVVAATLGENLTHYALALQAEPTLNKIKIAELEDLDNAAVGGVEYLQVKYQNNLCFIPELDILETKLKSVL